MDNRKPRGGEGGTGRGAVSPLGGRSNPDQSLRGGGSSGPLTRKSIAEAQKGDKPVKPVGKQEMFR